MCNAFSGLVTRTGTVKWKFAMDSHSELVEHFKLEDITADADKLKFAKFEIAPKNKDYLKPDKWIFKIDESITPNWFNDRHERACWVAHKKWLEKLDKILVRKKIVHPFKDIKPPKKITTKHIKLLKEWASVWDSVGASVWDSVYAYTGTFFNIPKWKYIKHKRGVYPFKSIDKLWNMGLVPSFDGKIWRLHGGRKAKILFEISKKELEKK